MFLQKVYSAKKCRMLNPALKNTGSVPSFHRSSPSTISLGNLNHSHGFNCLLGWCLVKLPLQSGLRLSPNLMSSCLCHTR